MIALHEKLRAKVGEWRKAKYESDYPAIAEILDYNYDPETQSLRYLRKAQFEALENYWYPRLKEGTPHIFELYKAYRSTSFIRNSDRQSRDIEISPIGWNKVNIREGKNFLATS